MPRKYQLLSDGRIRASLTFDGGLTARGVETRRHKIRSKPPHSSLASQSISTQGHWMAETLNGDGRSQEKLTQWLEALIREHAAANGWPLKGRARAVAVISLDKFINDPDCQMTDAQCAAMMGMKQRNYYKTWKRRIEDDKGDVIRWIRSWYLESLKV